MKLYQYALITLLLSGCGVYPPYYAWQQEWEGKAELAKADYSKQVAVQEAKAKEEAAHFLAQAEIERAKGVAQANQIIGNSLRDNEAYLRWLYIEGLKERNGIETIYVPTEAGIPILEAGKRHGAVAK
jgi:regulator of protease activity HflC (stomatin/prohibitin superfamily)